MGEWKRCSKCGDRVETFAVIGKSGRQGKTDPTKEARKCKGKKCGLMEVVTVVPKESTIGAGKRR